MNWKFWQKNKPTDEPVKPKSKLREWLDAIIFAGAAAMIIRGLFLEAFMIPTSSMERTMMVGDFLFVSKFHYGPRMVMAPLSIPLLHNKLPFVNVKSFVDWVRLPYWRLPGFTSVKRNDIVVFNFPAEDLFPNNPALGSLTIPSTKENYIKRCVAVGGDTLEIRDGDVYINGKRGTDPEEMQNRYFVSTNEVGFNENILVEKGFRKKKTGDGNANWGEWSGTGAYNFWMLLTPGLKKEMEKWDNVKSIQREIMPKNQKDPIFFPGDGRWNLDNFGPLYLPKRGDKIKLNKENIDVYKRCIGLYEQHDLKVDGDKIIIDGKEVTEYTFEMNYYFMMGDNRNNSQDSRFWGFVPEDHVIGTPMFVLFSVEGGLRWNRFFKIPH